MTVDSLDELLEWKPPYQQEVISEGILLPETAMILFGGAKAWKSMLSLYTAYCISGGKKWFGFYTSKSVTFRYQVELPKAVEQKRVDKFIRGVGCNGSKPTNMYFKTAPRAKIDTGFGKQSLEKDIAVVQARCPNQHLVLILDPAYLLITGHVSDDYDVRKLLDNLDELKAKYHISIILIHHSHKTRVDSAGNIIDLGSEEIMGSSYFNNWADTMVRVSMLNPHTGSNKVKLSFELSRHSQSVLPSFTIEWSRTNLQPHIIKKEILSEEEISVRNLLDEQDNIIS